MRTTKAGYLAKVQRQVGYYIDWNNCYQAITEGSVVLLQHPFHYSQLTREKLLYKLKKEKKVKFISVVHDVEELRAFRYNDYYKREFEVMPCISRMVLPFTLLFMICEQEGSKLFLEKFFDKYSQIMSLIAIVSLVFYFLGTLGGMLPKSEIQYYNNRWTYSCYSYFNIYFENPLQNLSYAPRNVGVFMEAPVFAIALIYALFWNLIKEKKNKFIIVILLVTMVTTLSTTAFIVGGLLISLYYYFNAKNRSIKIALRAFTPLLVVLAAWMIYLIMKTKMTTGNYGSVLIRLDDVGAAWKSFLQAPIFGAGFYNLEAIYSNFTYNTLKGDPTFGFINILAYGGIYLGLYYYGGLLWFVKSNILDKNGKILFVFMMSALLCSSPMQYSIMLYLFISAGYVAKLSSAKMNKNCHVNKEYNLSNGENG